MRNRFSRDATLCVHCIHVPLGPHACLESLVAPINQIANVAKEDDASVLVLADLLYVFFKKILVNVSRP